MLPGDTLRDLDAPRDPTQGGPLKDLAGIRERRNLAVLAAMFPYPEGLSRESLSGEDIEGLAELRAEEDIPFDDLLPPWPRQTASQRQAKAQGRSPNGRANPLVAEHLGDILDLKVAAELTRWSRRGKISRPSGYLFKLSPNRGSWSTALEVPNEPSSCAPKER